jgi:hypothetical protein
MADGRTPGPSDKRGALAIMISPTIVFSIYYGLGLIMVCQCAGPAGVCLCAGRAAAAPRLPGPGDTLLGKRPPPTPAHWWD